MFGSAFLPSWPKNEFGLYRDMEVLSIVKQTGCLNGEALVHTTRFWGGWVFPQLVINAVASFCVGAQLSGL